MDDIASYETCGPEYRGSVSCDPSIKVQVPMLQHSYLRVPIYHQRLAPIFQTRIRTRSYSAGHLPATL